MNKLYNKIKIFTDSFWFMLYLIITVPFMFYYCQDIKFVYWIMAIFLYIDIIKDFLKAIIKKLEKKIENYN